MGEGQRSLQEGYHLSERETGKGVPFTPRRGELTLREYWGRSQVLKFEMIGVAS